MADFQKEVIEASFQKPVVVDFWAEWCGPCRFLGPVIEELAQEAQGRWKLVKVNTEEQPDIAAQFQIRGIPNLKIFYKGQVVSELSGALPKPQLQKWLEENLPDERKKELKRLLLNIEEGTNTISDLEAFIKNHPDIEEAKAELVKKIWISDLEKAYQNVNGLSFKYEDLKNDIETLRNFLSSDFNDKSVQQYLTEAREALQEQNIEKTLDLLIQSIMIDKKCCEEIARKTVIAIFHLLGESHELTQKYRRKFSMALY